MLNAKHKIKYINFVVEVHIMNKDEFLMHKRHMIN